MPDRNLTPIATGLVAMVLVITLLLSGCNPANGVRDGEDAVEAAQTITRNRAKVDRIISDVMEEFDEDNPDSIVQGIKKYEEAALLLDEAVRLAPISTQPRLERFRLRKRIASGYHYLYAVADEECKPLEDDDPTGRCKGGIEALVPVVDPGHETAPAIESDLLSESNPVLGSSAVPCGARRL